MDLEAIKSYRKAREGIPDLTYEEFEEVHELKELPEVQKLSKDQVDVMLATMRAWAMTSMIADLSPNEGLQVLKALLAIATKLKKINRKYDS